MKFTTLCLSIYRSFIYCLSLVFTQLLFFFPWSAVIRNNFLSCPNKETMVSRSGTWQVANLAELVIQNLNSLLVESQQRIQGFRFIYYSTSGKENEEKRAAGAPHDMKPMQNYLYWANRQKDTVLSFWDHKGQVQTPMLWEHWMSIVKPKAVPI